jgi:hypothetical protein
MNNIVNVFLAVPALIVAVRLLCDAEDAHAYTTLRAPTAWRAPETFRHSSKGELVSRAGDVYMLGSCFLEVMTACARTPFDWLAGEALLVFRAQDSSHHMSAIQVHEVSMIRCLSDGSPLTPLLCLLILCVCCVCCVCVCVSADSVCLLCLLCLCLCVC